MKTRIYHLKSHKLFSYQPRIIVETDFCSGLHVQNQNDRSFFIETIRQTLIHCLNITTQKSKSTKIQKNKCFSKLFKHVPFGIANVGCYRKAVIIRSVGNSERETTSRTYLTKEEEKELKNILLKYNSLLT